MLKAARGREAINVLKTKVAALKNKREVLALALERKYGTPTNHALVDAILMTKRIENLLGAEEKVTSDLRQLDDDASQEPLRVMVVDPATTPKSVTNRGRIKYGLIAPWVALAIALGLNSMLSLVARRAANRERSQPPA
jgi:hypothetical protein